MMIQPYLFFDGRCEDAFARYRDILGAELEMLMRYRESPEPPPPECMPAGWEDKVMHASLRIGDLRLMGSDDGSGQNRSFQGFSLSLTASDEATAKRWFEGLAEDGAVIMPLGSTFFAPCFGMARDRYGVGWMVIVDPPET
jgi:PhnB protein